MNLVQPKKAHENAFWQYIRAWENESIIPGGIRKDVDYNIQLEEWEKNSVNYVGEMVPCEIYFLMNQTETIIYGIVSIRKVLNEFLKLYGGHIGYGINPCYRNLGYGTKLLELAVKKFIKFSDENILIVIVATNYPSQKVAQKVGAKFIKEVNNIGTLMYHYEIENQSGVR